MPLFYGRGLFGLPGILPYRVPITTVVGKPMDVPLIPEPSREQIAEYHRKYIQCGRISHWVRNMSFWKHCANYFPVKLVKTEDLDPERNYMFVCHPHGVMLCSHMVNFGTEGTGFTQLFPGLTSHILTLESLLREPFRRELLLAMGFGAATRTSMKWYLTHPGKGQVLALIVGGVLESFDTIPNTMRLTLNNRFGFVKLALEHG
ncbi:unnamed protein product [Oppiella nova]|uniref:Diacylglycerol O-acyltransferase n=1 Tax=Oppiella nova TaxID=334625 RepID=A0A7R9MH31_9ACAR|nr:unnamed protein product [Oppiella nova]CAG2176950.1 unnamed protein product [Oppiella nova]